MNKFRLILVIVITYALLSCNVNSQDYIEINQNNSKSLVIVRLAKDNENRIITIQFPNEISIKNNSAFDKSFVKVEYKYNKSMPIGRNLGIGLFKESESISTTGKKTVSSKSSLEYAYYTRHFVDSSKSTQLQFKSYVEKMIKQDKDTLHIGTVTNFKEKHKKLFEKLTKNDSISIQLLDGKKLGGRITVNVKW